MVKAGRAHKGDGKDVAHLTGNPDAHGAGLMSNLKLESKHKNRSYPRTKTAGKVNPKS